MRGGRFPVCSSIPLIPRVLRAYAVALAEGFTGAGRAAGAVAKQGALSKHFLHVFMGESLISRSDSNGEDLEGLAGGAWRLAGGCACAGADGVCEWREGGTHVRVCGGWGRGRGGLALRLLPLLLEREGESQLEPMEVNSMTRRLRQQRPLPEPDSTARMGTARMGKAAHPAEGLEQVWGRH